MVKVVFLNFCIVFFIINIIVCYEILLIEVRYLGIYRKLIKNRKIIFSVYNNFGGLSIIVVGLVKKSSISNEEYGVD